MWKEIQNGDNPRSQWVNNEYPIHLQGGIRTGVQHRADTKL